MRITTLSVLMGLVLLVLATGTGAVTAHENGENTDHSHDGMPTNGTAADWATWMEQRMTDHMGPQAADRMQDRMGMTYEEMGAHMTGMMNGQMTGSMMDENSSAGGCH